MRRVYIHNTYLKSFILVALLSFSACNQKSERENSSSQIENDETEGSQSNIVNEKETSEIGVLELAAQRNDLQAFTTAAALVDLQQVLDEAEGQFTIFAPTDNAFAAANLNITREDTANNQQLKNILLQHVVSYHTTSEYWYEEVMFTSLNGGRIVIHQKDSIPQVNEAKFITVDIAGKGGILHVIDKVLEPYPETAESPVQ